MSNHTAAREELPEKSEIGAPIWKPKLEAWASKSNVGAEVLDGLFYHRPKGLSANTHSLTHRLAKDGREN